ncbi:MAG: hypothetical protein ACUVXA_01600 [Candidatus Jordarchaeum sp.]|uniref:hypothetical protein n=1 Tax=Candidatus Jordarchaeum sp. TaxID=2823881 RepID=UPI004049EE4C
MSYPESKKVRLSKDVLQILFKPIGNKAVQNLVKSWGFGVVGDLKKDEIVNILDGKELILQKFLDLLLLNDMNTVFKANIWDVYNYSNSIKDITLNDLEKILNQSLKSNEEKASFKVFKIAKGKEYYIVYYYEEEPLLMELWDFDYKVINPVSHVRCILNLEKQTLLIGGDSKKKVEEFLKILQRALSTNFSPVTIPPYVLREVTENETVEKAAFACDFQISGVKGIQKITLEGDNVFDAIKGLKARQEIDFRRVGPIIEAETPKVYLSTEGKIILKDKKTKDKILKKIKQPKQ